MSPSANPSEPGQRRLLALLVFVVGAASLGAEIAAARLLAPYFGASTVVWANTIGVVLVALSVGYWFGGRFADRHPHMRGLCLLVLAAALLIAVVPFAARPFLGFSVDAFDSVSVGGFAGSLFGVLVLVAVPVTLLGAAAPWAVRLAVADVDRSGEVVGRLYATSTAGSLLGTMLAALLLIPLLGTQRTFLVFALALALVAAAGLGWRFLAVPALLALVFSLPVGTIKAADTGRVLYEAETTQEYARVVERPDGTRVLELNEGQAVHSLYRPGSYLTGDYWDGHLVLPFAGRGVGPPRRIAILGNGAGTVARAYGHFFPAHRGRRGRDRRRADRARPPLLRPAQPAHADLRRGRPALAAPLGRRLRRDHGRRLPPALHPLLPGDARVLRAGPRAAGAGRRRRSSTSATRRAATSWSGCSGGRWPRPSPPSCATRSSRPTPCCWRARRRSRRRGCGATRPALPPPLRPLAREAAAALAPAARRRRGLHRRSRPGRVAGRLLPAGIRE